MALDFLKSDKDVAAEWNKPAYVDPLPKAKDKLLKKLDAVLAAVKAKPGSNITRWYKVKEGKDGASVGLNVGAVSVCGDTTGGPDEIVKADAVAWFNTAKASVQKGEMDDMIRKAVENAPKSSAQTAQRAPSEVTREIRPELTHRRNVKRYGEDRAAELLDRNVKEKGWDKAKVLAAYKELPPLD